MKKFALILFTAAVIPALSAGYFDDKGWISGWKFAPLQIDLSLVKHRKLVDESSNTLFSFGLFLIEQKSAVFSSALVANSLYNNYGLQINPLLMGTVTDKNYGISIGFEEIGATAELARYMNQETVQPVDYVDYYDKENNLPGRVTVGVKWNDEDDNEVK